MAQYRHEKRNARHAEHVARIISTWLRENDGYHTSDEVVKGIDYHPCFAAGIRRILELMHRDGRITRKILESGEVGYAYS